MDRVLDSMNTHTTRHYRKRQELMLVASIFMLENLDIASDISPNDSVIFGNEYPERVGGVSYGACPTLAFKKSTTRLSMNHGFSSGGSSTNVEEKVY